FRDGQYRIFARCADTDGWHDSVRVSPGQGNCWNPAAAADTKEDRVWIGWDDYKQGNYEVRVRSLAFTAEQGATAVGYGMGEGLVPQESAGRFQAHGSLACDGDGRLWAAWDESGAFWGKDTGYLYRDSKATGLYAGRQISVRCLDGGRWKEPGTFEQC